MQRKYLDGSPLNLQSPLDLNKYQRDSTGRLKDSGQHNPRRHASRKSSPSQHSLKNGTTIRSMLDATRR